MREEQCLNQPQPPYLEEVWEAPSEDADVLSEELDVVPAELDKLKGHHWAVEELSRNPGEQVLVNCLRIHRCCLTWEGRPTQELGPPSSHPSRAGDFTEQLL